MLNRIFDAVMFRIKLSAFLMVLAAVIGVVSHGGPPKPRAGQSKDPWAADYVAPADGSTMAISQTSPSRAYRSDYDEETAKDEEFRRRKLREWRQMEEHSSQGTNAPDYHEN